MALFALLGVPRVSGCGVQEYASPQTLACPAIAFF